MGCFAGRIMADHDDCKTWNYALAHRKNVRRVAHTIMWRREPLPSINAAPASEVLRGVHAAASVNAAASMISCRFLKIRRVGRRVCGLRSADHVARSALMEILDMAKDLVPDRLNGFNAGPSDVGRYDNVRTIKD